MDENKDETQGTYKITDLFDQILGRHLERLIGAKCGIEELPLNIATISSLAFIMEKQTDPENDPSGEPELHTRETLFEELDELGCIDLDVFRCRDIRPDITETAGMLDNDSTTGNKFGKSDEHERFEDLTISKHFMRDFEESQFLRQSLINFLSEFAAFEHFLQAFEQLDRPWIQSFEFELTYSLCQFP